MSEPLSDDELGLIETMVAKWRSDYAREKPGIVDTMMTWLLMTTAEVRRLRQHAAVNANDVHHEVAAIRDMQRQILSLADRQAELGELLGKRAEKPSRPGLVKYTPLTPEQERLSREHQAAVTGGLEEILGVKFGPPLDLSEDRRLLTDGAPAEKPKLTTQEIVELIEARRVRLTKELTAHQPSPEELAEIQANYNRVKHLYPADPLPLAWTKEPPTVPGWYWERSSQNDEPYVYKVEGLSHHSPPKVACHDIWGEEFYHEPGGEWAGPIQPPV